MVNKDSQKRFELLAMENVNRQRWIAQTEREFCVVATRRPSYSEGIILYVNAPFHPKYLSTLPCERVISERMHSESALTEAHQKASPNGLV